MSREEQETIIRFDATPEKASVYTCDPVWLRKMEKLETQGTATLERDFGDGKEWLVDKGLVSVRPKRKSNMTEEQKDALRVRFNKGLGRE